MPAGGFQAKVMLLARWVTGGLGSVAVQRVTLQIIWRRTLHAIWRTLRVWTNWRGSRKRHPLSNGTGTNSDCPAAVVVETLEHRRFAEFCDACKKYRYIGLCYGSPGAGKTLSARHYANWENVQAYWNHQCRAKALLKEISKGSIAFYTSPVVSSPIHLERDIAKTRSLLHDAAIERARRYEDARMKRLLNRAEKLRDPKRNPHGYRSAEAEKAEDAFYEQRNRAMRVANTLPDPTRRSGSAENGGA